MRPPALREEYARRAGTAAAYREAAGITDPDQAVSPAPHVNNPELETLRGATIRALEIRDEAGILRGLSRGELEARILDGERAQASAPPDVSDRLRLTAQAEGDARAQYADTQVRHDRTGAASALALALHLAAERQRLDASNARYEQWTAGTQTMREAAGKARAELRRRGQLQPEQEPQAQPTGETQTTTGWRREFEADLQAVERTIARQHQAAIDAGGPWPPQRPPEPAPPSQASPDHVPDHRAARLDKLLARTQQAAQRVAARQADRLASSEYAARIEREAQTGPEAHQQAEARDEAEPEM